MLDRQPMRLLVITMLYEPDCVGIAAIASDMCAGLAERGHDVTVYTAYPYYPEWRRKSNVSPWRIRQESIRGVQVRRHGLYIPAKPSRLLPRMLHELSFPVSLMRSLAERQSFDAVMVYCPLLGSVAFAALRKMFFREPLWVNIQDIPADAAAASGFSRSRLFRGFAAFGQKCLLNCGEVWSTISPDMIRRLDAIKTAKTSLHLCPNWLTESLQWQIQQLPSKVAKPPHHPTKLLYCGTIGKKQGLLEFCRKLKTLDIDFRFQIHGGGGESEAVRRWVEASGDVRFDFAALLPEPEFVQAIHAADWFVVPEKPQSGFSFFPSKLIPCMSVGTPVLAICDRAGSLGREVTEHELGILVEWSRLDQLPAQFARYCRNPSLFTTLQKNCLRRAQAYDRDDALERLEHLLLDSPEQNDGLKVVRFPNGRRYSDDRLSATGKSASA